MKDANFLARAEPFMKLIWMFIAYTTGAHVTTTSCEQKNKKFHRKLFLYSENERSGKPIGDLKIKRNIHPARKRKHEDNTWPNIIEMGSGQGWIFWYGAKRFRVRASVP